jgi:DNA ligase D-like protein (predicted 3'-phosphoesterase)
MSIKTYRRKRDFTKTPEPRGHTHNPGKLLRFVVQQHDARTMHFDFRLEVDGTLKSWAVPKGPSIDPGVRRLAVPTEDHPLDYAGFEGVIPPKQYGAGAVIVWDRGIYHNLTRDSRGRAKNPARAIRDGHFVFNLKGHKLKGRFVLQRVGHGRDRRWFLIKAREENLPRCGEPVATQRKSVLSGRTVREVAHKESASR